MLSTSYTMGELIPADTATFSVPASRRLHTALSKTPWGRGRYRRWALVEGDDVVATVAEYDLRATLDGNAVRVCGLGDLTVVGAGDAGHTSQLVDLVLAKAQRDGTHLGLLCAAAGTDSGPFKPSDAIALSDLTLRVAEPIRYGAPMTMVRGGEERDFAAIVEMGRRRCAPFRFHLDRDADFVHWAIAKERLRAGLAAPSARQLQFFIAEEGVTAAAYVVLSVIGDTWTLEECGDRDPTGARVGALLQALLAREPSERRPEIRGWLPHGFLPPQVTIASAVPSTDVVLVRALSSRIDVSGLQSDAVLFWHADLL